MGQASLRGSKAERVALAVEKTKFTPDFGEYLVSSNNLNLLGRCEFLINVSENNIVVNYGDFLEATVFTEVEYPVRKRFSMTLRLDIGDLNKVNNQIKNGFLHFLLHDLSKDRFKEKISGLFYRPINATLLDGVDF